MTPQSHFMVVARVLPSELPRLRTLLNSMNLEPGLLNPANTLVPFARLSELHFARLVILDDQTQGDLATIGGPKYDFPPSLAFLADFDGERDAFLQKLVAAAGPGLREIFSCCEGFPGDGEIKQWMDEQEHPPSANYVNWIGRTMQQVREEKALHEALCARVPRERRGRPAVEVCSELLAFARTELKEGRLTLTPESATKLGWRLGNLLHLVSVPLALLVFSPLLLLVLPVYAVWLRHLEKTDPEVIPAPDPAHVQALEAREDHFTTNQFSAMGSLKPGLFRRWSLVFFLWVLEWGARHVYFRGALARVGTIHFARFVFLNDKRRLFFGSNYDGSLDSYMDDFINKVSFGLNLFFCHGVGYPRVRWLLLDGAKDEQKFKNYIRRHQLPTEVWYNGHAGLSAVDLKRNGMIRQGFEKPPATEEEARAWLSLI